eukprot:07115.XXX_79817_79957_1 [CDS] Oithona nana genome sequencing.
MGNRLLGKSYFKFHTEIFDTWFLARKFNKSYFPDFAFLAIVVVFVL